MRFVYYDYGGAHTSVTAACIHTGKLNTNKLPAKEDLMAMPFLDKTTPDDFGKFKLIGHDKNGNEVYSLGTKNSHMGSLLDDLASMEGVANQYMFLCTSPYVNNVLRIGGFLSRAVSLPAIGRPLVVTGLRKAFPTLCTFVETARIKQEGKKS